MTRPKIQFQPRGLELSDEDFDAVHRRLDRAGAKVMFSCPTDPMRRLLADFSRYVAHVDELEARLRRPDPAGKPT